jgi:hypothetical protein
MVKNEELVLDDADRIKKLAFWYWEYLRRNTCYKKYSDAIKKYRQDLRSEGCENLDKIEVDSNKLFSDGTRQDFGFDFSKLTHLKQLRFKYGHDLGKIIFMYVSLMRRFKKKFGRNYKDHLVGMNTDETLGLLLSGKTVQFATNNANDISALLRLADEWSMLEQYLIRDEAKCRLSNECIFQVKVGKINSHNALRSDIDKISKHMQSFCENKNDVNIDLGLIKKDPKNAALQMYALSLIKDVQESVSQKNRIDDEVLKPVYRLLFSGKHIKTPDDTRLVALWLWDKAREQNAENPDHFDDVYSILRQRINDKESDIAGNWEQTLSKPNRIRQHFEMTDFCIENRLVANLKK